MAKTPTHNAFVSVLQSCQNLSFYSYLHDVWEQFLPRNIHTCIPNNLQSEYNQYCLCGYYCFNQIGCIYTVKNQRPLCKLTINARSISHSHSLKKDPTPILLVTTLSSQKFNFAFILKQEFSLAETYVLELDCKHNFRDIVFLLLLQSDRERLKYVMQ